MTVKSCARIDPRGPLDQHQVSKIKKGLKSPFLIFQRHLSATSTVQKLLQATLIQDPDVTLLDLQQTIILEF